MKGYLLKMGGLGKEKKRIGTQCLSRRISLQIVWRGAISRVGQGKSGKGGGTDRVIQGAPAGGGKF
jgi:hypothetical protein